MKKASKGKPVQAKNLARLKDADSPNSIISSFFSKSPVYPLANSSSAKKNDLLDRFAGGSKSFFKMFIIFSAIFLLLGFIVFFLSPSFFPRPSWSWSVAEGPLAKNAYLNISPGDTLTYSLGSGGGNQLIYIGAFSSPTCPGVLLVDLNAKQSAGAQVDPSYYSVCLGPDGTERSSNGTRIGSNLSFSNLSWPYFQAWMLALDDHFVWPVNATLTIMPFNITQVTSYRYWVSNHSVYMGRDAYEVRVHTQTLSSASSVPQLSADVVSAELPVDLWVDGQSRFLLYGKFANSTLTLVDAPFFGTAEGGVPPSPVSRSS